MMTIRTAATRTLCSLPPCGGESLTLPHKGGGNGGSVPRIVRAVLLAAALITVSGVAAKAQTRDDLAAVQVLRANVTVTGNLVRIGDVIDNAGASAQIAIYRAPDLGTTGSLPVAQLLATL